MDDKKNIRINKKKEYRLAYNYYVEQGKTAKDTATQIGLSESTVLKWVNANNWKEARNAIFLSSDKQTSNIKEILNDLAEARIELSRNLKETNDTKEKTRIRAEMASLDDGASKWNKVLSQVNKENKISLPVYLTVCQEVFDDLRSKHPKIYELIFKADFEAQHILLAAQKYS